MYIYIRMYIYSHINTCTYEMPYKDIYTCMPSASMPSSAADRARPAGCAPRGSRTPLRVWDVLQQYGLGFTPTPKL